MHKIREIKRIGIQKQFQITHILELSLLGYHYVLLRHKIKNCVISYNYAKTWSLAIQNLLLTLTTCKIKTNLHI